MKLIASILITLICLNSLILASNVHHKQYMPEQLKNIPSIASEIQLFDPDQHLTSDLIPEMEIISKNIKEYKNFEIFIYVISYIDKKYGPEGDKDIDWFTNDLTYSKLSADTERDEKSIFIVFSMKDRQSRVRTGKEVKYVLQDSKLETYLSEIRHNLQNNKFNAAILQLLISIETRLMTKYQRIYDIFNYLWNLFLQMLVVLFIACVIAAISIWREKSLSKSAEDQLKKIKRITENGKPRREIIEKVCVICLEDLVEQSAQKEVPSNLSNGLSTEVTSELELENLKEKEVEDNSSNKDNFIAKLECGHSFHSKCISEWMTKNGKCPVCRENIDKEENPPRDEKPQEAGSSLINSNATSTSFHLLTRSLINIQSTMHPELSTLDYTYGANSLNWSLPRPPQNSRSSHSYSWGKGGGGASSKW